MSEEEKKKDIEIIKESEMKFQAIRKSDQTILAVERSYTLALSCALARYDKI